MVAEQAGSRGLRTAGHGDLEFKWPSSGKAQLGKSQGIYYPWSPAPNRADGWSCSSSYKQLGPPSLFSASGEWRVLEAEETGGGRREARHKPLATSSCPLGPLGVSQKIYLRLNLIPTSLGVPKGRSYKVNQPFLCPLPPHFRVGLSSKADVGLPSLADEA